MSVDLPLLISWLQLYGYPALWASIFVAAIGAPLPISLVLLAAGAFAALGDFDILLLALIGVSASVAGDSVGYLIGRRFGSKVLHWLAQHKHIPVITPQRLERSQAYFHKRGSLAIFLSRFLVPALGGTMNLLAGAELYPYRRFLLYDFSGETLGAILPLVLGYTFGASWEAVGDIFATVSTLIIALLIAVYLTFRLFNMLKRMDAAKASPAPVLKSQKKVIAEIGRKSLDSLPL